MMPYKSLPIPILFLRWITSGEGKWITLAERRSQQGRNGTKKVRDLKNPQETAQEVCVTRVWKRQ